MLPCMRIGSLLAGWTGPDQPPKGGIRGAHRAGSPMQYVVDLPQLRNAPVLTGTVLTGWTGPDPTVELPKEASEEACALASLMQSVVDVPELSAAAPHAQLSAASPLVQLLGCDLLPLLLHPALTMAAVHSLPTLCCCGVCPSCCSVHATAAAEPVSLETLETL